MNQHASTICSWIDVNVLEVRKKIVLENFSAQFTESEACYGKQVRKARKQAAIDTVDVTIMAAHAQDPLGGSHTTVDCCRTETEADCWIVGRPVSGKR